MSNFKTGDVCVTRDGDQAVCYGAIPEATDSWAVGWRIKETDSEGTCYHTFETDPDGFEFAEGDESSNDIIGPWADRVQLAGG